MKGSVAVAIPLWLLLIGGAIFLYMRMRKSA